MSHDTTHMCAVWVDQQSEERDSRIPPFISTISIVPSLAGGVVDQRAHVVDCDVDFPNHRALN